MLRDDPWGDARALEQLALRLLRFTPDVCLDGAAALQLEIGRTAGHFGGEEALRRELARQCGSLGHSVTTAAAATPEAARVLARAALLGCALGEERLTAAPWQALAPDPAVAEACRALGARSVGDLLALPRAGLATRTTIAFVQQLQRMTGELEEPLVRVSPPDRFDDEVELLAPVDAVAPLLFAAKQLFDGAEAWLEGQARALLAATVTFVPSGRERPLALELAPAEPTRRARLLAQLLGHRLERTRLPGPIERVALAVARTVACRAEQEALFDGADGRAREREVVHAAALLRDRLAVKLGRDRVLQAELVADPRPERAFRWRGHGEEAGRRDAAAFADRATPGPRPLELEQEPRRVEVVSDAEGRPLALREHGRVVALSVVRGPERIDGGWWDGHDVSRRYFEVATPSGARLWLFRDLAGGDFFLHGAFC